MRGLRPRGLCRLPIQVPVVTLDKCLYVCVVNGPAFKHICSRPHLSVLPPSPWPGSVQVELGYLSELTGDKRYAFKANHVYDFLERALPEGGLYPLDINLQTGRLSGLYYGVGEWMGGSMPAMRVLVTCIRHFLLASFIHHCSSLTPAHALTSMLGPARPRLTVPVPACCVVLCRGVCCRLGRMPTHSTSACSRRGSGGAGPRGCVASAACLTAPWTSSWPACSRPPRPRCVQLCLPPCSVWMQLLCIHLEAAMRSVRCLCANLTYAS
jgi:hypothetical protein